VGSSRSVGVEEEEKKRSRNPRSPLFFLTPLRRQADRALRLRPLKHLVQLREEAVRGRRRGHRVKSGEERCVFFFDFSKKKKSSRKNDFFFTFPSCLFSFPRFFALLSLLLTERRRRRCALLRLRCRRRQRPLVLEQQLSRRGTPQPALPAARPRHRRFQFFAFFLDDATTHRRHHPSRAAPPTLSSSTSSRPRSIRSRSCT